MEMSNEVCQNTFNTMWTRNLSNLSLNINNYHNEKKSHNLQPVNYGYIDDKAIRMMAKMGFQTGSGLGKNNQGIVEPIELQTNLGRSGFGHDKDKNWDFTLEEIIVEEKADWLNYLEDNDVQKDDISSWIKLGERKTIISDETKYCDSHLLQEVLKAKEIFDEFDVNELSKARTRANPFETIKSVFFMNRAALKMANIDAATDFMFTNIDRQIEHKQMSNPYYFADICAGPGGFSEYIFWRKRWSFKGFGLTLRGEHDFKLHESTCAASETFEALYGARDDGNIYYPENIEDFCATVKKYTSNLGVHFVMGDGGFSVEGQENFQEVLSRQIYTCQCLTALKCLRENGHFVTKLFDLFTPFSVGLIYLMRRCFHKIAILKPNSSRPANAERYLICSKLINNAQTKIIEEYIEKIVKILYDLRMTTQQLVMIIDVVEIVPEHVIKKDTSFTKYIIESNNRLAEKQIFGLMKLGAFCRDPSLSESRQEELRKKCLEYWRIPCKPKTPLPHMTTDELLTSSVLDTDFMFSTPEELLKAEELDAILTESQSWHCTFVATAKKCNLCNIYVGLGRNRVYRFQKNRWIRVKNVELVRGTIIFAELVKEFSNNEKTTMNKKCLHVIDALRLGDISVNDLPYKERFDGLLVRSRNISVLKNNFRLDLIGVYCKAVNKMSRNDLSSVRLKPVLPLPELSTVNFPKINDEGKWLLDSLANINSVLNPCYQVNSLLFFKTESNLSFDSTLSSRVILSLPTIFDIENKIENEKYILWEYFKQCLKIKN